MSAPVVGIIAEYNPLHAGHLWHIRQTRKQLGADTRVVVVMSGHAVQRGDVPILDKFTRSALAVRAGADLVLELPLPHALGCAERFARAGVGILHRLGCVTHLSFGSEAGGLAPLRAAAAMVPEKFPPHQSLAGAYPALYLEQAALFTPNNILGIEYLRALRYHGSAIEPVTAMRRGSAHDDAGLSASALRGYILDRRPCPDGALPEFTERAIAREAAAGRAPLTLRGRDAALLAQLRRLSPGDFAALPEVSGGLENRLYRAAQRADSYPMLMALAKTRRFTAARLRRAFLCAFFGVTEQDALRPPPLRLLAIGENGRGLLAQTREPVISRAAAHRAELELEVRATDLLGLLCPRPWPGGRELTQPVIAPSVRGAAGQIQ